MLDPNHPVVNIYCTTIYAGTIRPLAIQYCVVKLSRIANTADRRHLERYRSGPPLPDAASIRFKFVNKYPLVKCDDRGFWELPPCYGSQDMESSLITGDFFPSDKVAPGIVHGYLWTIIRTRAQIGH